MANFVVLCEQRMKVQCDVCGNENEQAFIAQVTNHQLLQPDRIQPMRKLTGQTREGCGTVGQDALGPRTTKTFGRLGLNFHYIRIWFFGGKKESSVRWELHRFKLSGSGQRKLFPWHRGVGWLTTQVCFYGLGQHIGRGVLEMRGVFLLGGKGTHH
jgi:hypothetical protein